MKVIYFIAFIAKPIGILCLSLGCAIAQNEPKKEIFFCFTVYKYVYLNKKINIAQKDEWLRNSFDFLQKQVHELEYYPLLTNFNNKQVVYYFLQPCVTTMKNFPNLIAKHNEEFKNRIMLVPQYNYKSKDFECIFSKKLQPDCPAGQVSFDNGIPTLERLKQKSNK